MKRSIFLIPILIAIFSSLNGTASTQDTKPEKKIKVDSIPLTGYIYDRLTTRELPSTYVQILRSDSSLISTTKGGHVYYNFNNGAVKIDSTSRYEIFIPRVQGDYIIKVTKSGYEDYYTSYKAIIGSRVNELKAPKIYLGRQKVTELQELTVKSSKIKVYHKGDTLVYNAAAFNLPEGSMLDALVQQMRGVEIKENMIYVNGRFVETLLLNGKEFFKGDPSVAMHNIGAYTVKDVAVYEKAEDSAAILGDRDDVKKDYVMDVRLKKDYMTGTAVNMDGGYGTRGRYIGRIFGLGYTNNSRLSVYGNTNNINKTNRLNETGEVGVYGPDNGIAACANGGVDYKIDNAQHTWEIAGNADVHYKDIIDHETTNALQYLQSADNYMFSDKGSRLNNLTVSTNHDLNLKHEKWNLYVSPSFSYNKENSHSERYSATFDKEFNNMDREIVKNLYKENYANFTTSLINRIVKLYDGNSHGYNSQLATGSKIKIPNSPDAMEFKANISYNRSTVHGMTWQDMCFGNLNGMGQNPVSSLLQQQNQVIRPDYNFRLLGLARYYFTLPFGSLNASYEYIHTQSRKNISLMMLESMAQGTMAEFQPGQLWMPDFANSYESKKYKNQHHLKLIWKVKKKYEKGSLEIGIEPNIYLERHDLLYNQAGIEMDPSKSFVRFKVANTSIRWASNKNKFTMTVYYDMDQVTPDLMSMTDMINSSDPMNIWKGNPNLKKSTKHCIGFYLTKGRGGRLFQGASGRVQITQNAFANGYRYNSSTGVKEMKTYNVNGNNSGNLYYWISYNLDKAGDWHIRNSIDAGMLNYSNIIGYDADPMPQKARNINFTENLRLSMSKKNVDLSIIGEYGWCKSKSFTVNPISNIYTNLLIAFSADLKLPYNFSIETKVGRVKKSGFIDSEINKAMWIADAELKYSAMKGALLFSLSGEDLFNQFSFRRISTDATGYTQTDRLTLGRIILFKVAYKFHHKPKRGKK